MDKGIPRLPNEEADGYKVLAFITGEYNRRGDDEIANVGRRRNSDPVPDRGRRPHLPSVWANEEDVERVFREPLLGTNASMELAGSREPLRSEAFSNQSLYEDLDFGEDWKTLKILPESRG